MFGIDTYKAFRKLVKIQQKQTELSKTQNALSKLEKINRKNEGKIQEKIVSLEKEIESLTGTSRPTRKQGVKVEEKTQQIFSGNSQSTETKIVESDKATETTEKIQEATKVQPRRTAFFDKDLLKNNELAIKMKMKRNGVEVELIESEAMKKSKHNDKVMRVKKGFSSDKMVKVLKAELEWFKEKGLHPEPFQASFNQGGESL
jgi:hypothetical protein